jgi:chorismate mutase/prephenate dehydratase
MRVPQEGIVGEWTVNEELKGIRQSIDKTDQQLLKLLNERMELVREVGRIKAANGLELFDPGREEIIYRRLSEANPGPLTHESLRSIYREILAASRLLQYPLKVAFLGPEWTYSYLAALSLFGHSAQYLPFPTLEEVFDAVSKGRARVGLAPIENTLEGGVGLTIDLLYQGNVQVLQECYLEVAHCLCGHSPSIKKMKNLYAHPQALGQCRRWLLEHCRHAQWHECPSTAQAARLAQKDPVGGAICNLYAAYHYELSILAERIEDHPGNITRFFALAHHFNPPTGNDKTSILFAVSDRPGALHAALEPFTCWQVNMTRIESRPNRTFPWQYLFYADFEGHQDEAKVQKMLNDLRNRVTFLKILGSYAQSDSRHPIRFENEKMRPSRQVSGQ